MVTAPLLIDNSFELAPGDVHVWQLRCEPCAAKLDELFGLLSPAEQDRASRFIFPEHRRRYIAAHAALRQILAGYLRLDPKGLEFREGAQGKPALCLTPEQIPLMFNLSHSHEAALVALTLEKAIGVDIEQVKLEFDWQGIVNHFFAAGEIASLQALPPAMQRGAFFACWTRKESYIKAKGGGLSIALDGFEVTVHPTEPVALLSCASDPQEIENWSMANLDVGPDYAAALTVEGKFNAIKLGSWSF